MSKKPSKKLKVALLFGGKSGEHEVSVVSASSIFNALDKSRYDITLIGIDKKGRWVLVEPTLMKKVADNPRLLKLAAQKATVCPVPFGHRQNLVALSKGKLRLPKKLDVVLPILHGPYGEDGTVQGLLELSGLPYVGSGVLGSALGMDKEVSRRLLRDAGIPVVPFKVVRRQDFQKNSQAILEDIAKTFQFPYFVKPANMGSSVGVNKVKSTAEAAAKFKDAFLYDTKILVERGLAARELECAVLGNHDPRASIVGEIVPKHDFYSYEAKYLDDNGADLLIPAQGLTSEMTEQIRELSVKAFKALECKGMARVDFFLDKLTGELYLNEINTIPGFTKISMYPKLWDASGLAYPKLLDELIDLALKSSQERASLKTEYVP